MACDATSDITGQDCESLNSDGYFFFGWSAADGDNSAGGFGAGAASAADAASAGAAAAQQGSHFGLQPIENSDFKQVILGNDNLGMQDFG